MGCCFSKEAKAEEKRRLLHTLSQERIHDSVERVRYQAMDIAQVVCLDEEKEEESGPDHGEPRPPLDSQTRMVVGEENLQVRRSYGDQPAFLVPVFAVSAPYLEMNRSSPARQNIAENASPSRAQWFTPNLKLVQPEGRRSDCGEVSREQKSSSISAQDRVSLASEDHIVTMTPGQDFQTRTRRFCSICSIDANNLDQDDRSQDRVTGTDPGLSQTTSPQIQDLQVDPQMTSGTPEGNRPMLTKEEVDLFDQTEERASSVIQTSKGTSATFQENQIDHIQHSQPAGESPKEVHSVPEPEQQNKQQDKSSQTEDDATLNKSEEGNATLAQVTTPQTSSGSPHQRGSFNSPGLIDEEKSCDQFQTSKETPATVQENHPDQVRHSQTNMMKVTSRALSEQETSSSSSVEKIIGDTQEVCEEDTKTTEEPANGPPCDEEEPVRWPTEEHPP
ncbi:uncharacterized protein LOC144009270 isoform X2 [Festucalex cinctus]